MSLFSNIQKLYDKENKSSVLNVHEYEELIKSIDDARREIECANQSFSYATDPILVDAYAYQIKSAQAKYSYLLTRAKRMEIARNNCAYIKRGDR